MHASRSCQSTSKQILFALDGDTESKCCENSGDSLLEVVDLATDCSQRLRDTDLHLGPLLHEVIAPSPLQQDKHMETSISKSA